MKLTRREIIRQLAREGYFPGKWGYRVIIGLVRDYERWQAKRAAA